MGTYKPVTVVAMPVYTPKDYPHIRQLPGADDMPATWEEWSKHFEAYQKTLVRGQGYGYARVRIRPDLLKAWLDGNSQVASESSRQRYAQELRDMRSGRIEEAHEEAKLLAAAANALVPDPLPYRMVEIGSWILMGIAVISALIALMAHYRF